MYVTEALADFGVKLRYEDLPEEVAHETKRLLFDCIGCALAGHSIDKGKISVQLAQQLQGPPESTIIGGQRVSSPNSAFANGELINALDFDPLSWPTGHISPYVIPACLALAEKLNASGKQLILAMALAHEVATRIGSALSTLREPIKGADGSITYQPAPVFGYTSATIGGVIGAGRVLNLSLSKMLNAIGIAGYNTQLATGVKFLTALPIAMTKYSSAGWSSQAEVTAALLAELGYTGDKTVLDGEYAFWRFFGSQRWEPDKVLSQLGKTWLFPGLAEYKIYPLCGIIRKGLDGFVKLMEEHDFSPDDIEEVRVFLTEFHISQPIWYTRDIRGAHETQFSIPYAYAVVAHRVPYGIECQEETTIKNKDVLQFMDKVKLLPFPRFDQLMAKVDGKEIPSKSQPTIIEVVARGKTFREEVLYARGANIPATVRSSDAELAEKFAHNASRKLDTNKVKKLTNAVFALDEIADINELTRLFQL